MGLFNKNHNFVVMDGTDKKKVWTIIANLTDVLGQTVVNVRPLDEKHQSMIVIKYKTGFLKQQKLRRMLEQKYPGLCSYDVAV